MPFGGGRTSTINISGLNWDTNLTIPTGYTIEITDSTCVGQTLKGVIMTLGGTP